MLYCIIRMRIINLFALFSLFFSSSAVNEICTDVAHPPTPVIPNNCISFIVGSGTGCDWMCNYCANQLGTNNYYFVDGICTYQSGGCVGSPIAGKQYSCCSA